MPKQVFCQICEKGFSVRPSSKAKYCSWDCEKKGRSTGIFSACDQCKKQIWIFKCESHRKNHFCCVECRKNFQKHENHPRWKNGNCLDGHGYNMIRINGKYVYEHRYLMEIKLNRKLNTNEQVHHINEIKTDNRIENLTVLLNSDHQKLHKEMCESFWSKKYENCLECGTKEIRHFCHGLCRNCYMRDYHKKRKIREAQV